MTVGLGVFLGILIGGLTAIGTIAILPVLLTAKPSPKAPEGLQAEPPATSSRALALWDEFRNLAAAGRTAVYLNPRDPSARLPEQFKHMDRVRLDFSYHFAPPDLRSSAAGISQTLSFRGLGTFPVFVPWSAVLTVTRAPDTEPPVGIRVLRLIPGDKNRLN